MRTHRTPVDLDPLFSEVQDLRASLTQLAWAGVILAVALGLVTNFLATLCAEGTITCTTWAEFIAFWAGLGVSLFCGLRLYRQVARRERLAQPELELFIPLEVGPERQVSFPVMHYASDLTAPLQSLLKAAREQAQQSDAPPEHTEYCRQLLATVGTIDRAETNPLLRTALTPVLAAFLQGVLYQLLARYGEETLGSHGAYSEHFLLAEALGPRAVEQCLDDLAAAGGNPLLCAEARLRHTCRLPEGVRAAFRDLRGLAASEPAPSTLTLLTLQEKGGSRLDVRLRNQLSLLSHEKSTHSEVEGLLKGQRALGSRVVVVRLWLSVEARLVLRVGRVRNEREALYRDEWWRLLVGTICENLDREEVFGRARRDRGKER